MPYTFKYGDRPLDGITIQRAIGRGGFGEVYYAVADSGKQLALKYLRENPDIELRGIGHVMNLKSPHLITIYDVKRGTAGEPFVLMEYVSGPSLRELMLAEPQGMGPQKAAFFLRGICQGLTYLHERGIVHRDLKPANIFYDDGYVKIGDYGLSKHMSVSQHSGQTVSVGTVHYMAPEIGSGSYTQAIDIYALGVILYEMLTGKLPFSGASMGEILMRHLRDDPDLRAVPAPFAKVIAKSLEKDPARRYQSADEMLADVMESAEISTSVSAFDASMLTQVARSPEASDADPTWTSPPRPTPPPPLDARMPPPVPGPQPAYARPAPEQAGLDRHRVKRTGQIVVLSIVAVAIATVLGLLVGPRGGDPPVAVIFTMLIVGGVIGPLLVHLRFLPQATVRSPLLIKLAYASVAALFMMPGMLVASEELHDGGLARVALAPLAAMFFCNWGARIDAGRRGQVSGGSAFWPAAIGLIAVAIANEGDSYIWAGAAIAAAVSLLTQAAASMWPLTGPEPQPAGAVPGRGYGKRGHHRAPMPCGPPVQPPAGEPAGPRPGPAGPPPAPAPWQAPPPAAPVVVETVQPSFAGRTASAGLSFVAKAMLLFGLVLTVGRAPLAMQAARWDIAPEVIGPLLDIPVGLVLLLLTIGCLLLVLARRQFGVAHFVRGCLGCAAWLWTAIIASATGYRGMYLLCEARDIAVLRDEAAFVPLVFMLFAFGIGAVLLLWPPAQRNRTIVI